MNKGGIKIAEAIGKRDKLGIYSIFPQVLQKELSHIENIPYKDKIFVPKDRKQDNVFEELYDSLRKLWVERYGLSECFEIFEIYRKFEPMLFKGSHYRDHFIHQYLVFLTGLPIINQFSPDIRCNLSRIDGVTEKLIDVEKSWLLASTYHDISYPIQRFEDWLKLFFIDFLNIETNLIYINMSQILLEKDYLLNFQRLSDFLYRLYKKIYPVLKKDYLDRLCMENFLGRNHGIFSSLILLDKYDICLGPGSEKYSQNTFLSQVLPSAAAIALHDSNVWGKEITSHIVFEKDPITFLLIYCDTVQEWGRPLPCNIQQSPYVPLMTDYKINNQRVSITLTYDVVEEVKLNGTTSTNFDSKKEAISSLFSKLKSSSVRFEIVLKSTDKDFGYDKFVGKTKDN